MNYNLNNSLKTTMVGTVNFLSLVNISLNFSYLYISLCIVTSFFLCWASLSFREDDLTFVTLFYYLCGVLSLLYFCSVLFIKLSFSYKASLPSFAEEFAVFWDKLDFDVKRKYGMLLLMTDKLKTYAQLSSKLVFSSESFDFTGDISLDTVLSRLTPRQKMSLVNAFLNNDKGAFKRVLLRSFESNGERRFYLIKKLWDCWTLTNVAKKRLLSEATYKLRYSSEGVESIEDFLTGPYLTFACGIISLHAHIKSKNFKAAMAALQNLIAAMKSHGLDSSIFQQMDNFSDSVFGGGFLSEGPDPDAGESLINKLIAIMGVISALPILASLGITHMDSVNIMLEHLSSLKGIWSLREKIVEFMKLLKIKYEQVKKDGLWAALMGPTLHDWRLKVNTMQRASATKALLSQDYEEVLKDIDTYLQQGVKYSTHPHWSILDKLAVVNLNKLKMDLIVYWESLRARKTPLSLVLIGDPGVGKSSLVTTVKELLAEIEGRKEPTDQDVYPVTLSDKHWNNCRKPKIILFDDVRGTGHIPQTDEQCFPEVLTKLINHIAFATPQASIEDKMANCIAPEMVICSSNDYVWNFEQYSDNWLKLVRRLPYVYKIVDNLKLGTLDDNVENAKKYTYLRCKAVHAHGKIKFVETKVPLGYVDMLVEIRQAMFNHHHSVKPELVCRECPLKSTFHDHSFQRGTYDFAFPGNVCFINCPVRAEQYALCELPNYPIAGIDYVLPKDIDPMQRYWQFFLELKKVNRFSEILSDFSIYDPRSLIRFRVPEEDPAGIDLAIYLMYEYMALPHKNKTYGSFSRMWHWFCNTYVDTFDVKKETDVDMFFKLSNLSYDVQSHIAIKCWQLNLPIENRPASHVENVKKQKISSSNPFDDFVEDLSTVFDQPLDLEGFSSESLSAFDFVSGCGNLSYHVVATFVCGVLTLVGLTFVTMFSAFLSVLYSKVKSLVSFAVNSVSFYYLKGILPEFPNVKAKLDQFLVDTWVFIMQSFRSLTLATFTQFLMRHLKKIIAIIAAVCSVFGAKLLFDRMSGSNEEEIRQTSFRSEADRLLVSQINGYHPITRPWGYQSTANIDASKMPFAQNDAPQVDLLPSQNYSKVPLADLALANTKTLWLPGPESVFLGYCFTIDSNHTLVTGHQYRKMTKLGQSPIMVANLQFDNSMPNGHQMALDLAAVYLDTEKDLALLWHATTQDINLSSRFAELKHIAAGDHNVTVFGEELVAELTKTTGIMDNPNDAFMFNNAVMKYPKSNKGACSRPCVLRNVGQAYKGEILFGIHVAGDQKANKGISSFISQTWINHAKSAIPKQHKFRVESAEFIVPKMFDFNGDPIRCQLFAAGENPIPAGFIGTIGPLRNKSKSSTQPTKFHPDLIDKMETKLEVPNLGCKGYMLNGTWTSPATHYIKYFNTYPVWLRYEFMNMAIADYLENLPPGKANPLSLEQAICGVPGHPLLKKMNLNSSIGSWKEYFKTKSDVLSLTEIHPDLYRETMAYLEFRADGYLICNYQEVNWKDEPVKASKNVTLKMRPFAVFEKSCLIAARALLLPIIAYCYEHKEYFEAYGAFNPASPQFETLIELMISTIFMHLGDIAHMDASARAFMADGVSEIIRDLAEHLGYSALDVKLAVAIVRELCHSITCLNRDIYIFNEKLGSGHLMTFFFNCLCLSILYRYAWITHYLTKKKNPPRFRLMNTLACGGDDSAHATLDPTFDFFAIKQGFSYLGYEYTSARKDGREDAHSTLDEFVFLKRVPVKINIEGTDRIVGQLALDSIYKNLCFILPSRSITYEDQMAAKMDAAIREASLHPEEVFLSIKGAITNHYPNFPFKTRDQYLSMYVKGELYTEMLMDMLQSDDGVYQSEGVDDGLEYCPNLTYCPRIEYSQEVSPIIYSLMFVWVYFVLFLYPTMATYAKRVLHPEWYTCFFYFHMVYSYMPLLGMVMYNELIILSFAAVNHSDLSFKYKAAFFHVVSALWEERVFGPTKSKILFSIAEYFMYVLSTEEVYEASIMRLLPLSMHLFNSMFPEAPVFRGSVHVFYNIYFVEYFIANIRDPVCGLLGEFQHPALCCLLLIGSSPVVMSDHLDVLQKRELRKTNSKNNIDPLSTYPSEDIMRLFLIDGDPLQSMSIWLFNSVTLLTDLNITSMALSSDLLRESHHQPGFPERLKPNSLMSLYSQFQRPVRVDGFVWTASTTPVTRTDLYGQYFSDPTVSNLVSSYKYFKGQPVLTFVVNGFSMWFGKCIIAPYYNSNTSGTLCPSVSTWDFVSAMNVPHVSVDPSKCSTYQFSPIWYNQYEWYNFTASNNPTFDLTMFPQFLSSVNTTAPTSVEIIVYMHFENVQLTVPYQSESEDFATDLEQMKISKPLTALASFIQPGDSLISAASTASGVALPTSRSVSSVAKAFQKMGYGSPASIVQAPILVKTAQSGNTISNQYGDSSYKLYSSPSSAIPVDCASAGLGDESEKFWSGISRKWGYVSTYSWTVEAVDQELGNFCVTPMVSYTYGAATPTYYRLTPLATCASLHEFSTGSVDLKFEVVCSEYHRGSLAISVSPDFAFPPIDRRPTALQTVILDVNKTKEVIVNVPCLHESPLYLMPDVHDSLTAMPDAYAYLKIYSVTQLKSMGSASPVQVNVYIRSGDDFCLYRPTHNGEKFATEGPDMPTDSEEQQASNDYVRSEVPLRSLQLFGEKSNNLMDVLGIPFPTQHITLSASATVPNMTILHLPTRPTTISASSAGFRTSPLAFLSACFLATRGGFRVKLYTLRGAAPFSFAELTSYDLVPSTPYNMTVLTTFEYGYGGSGRILLSTANSALTGLAEFEVPIRGPHRFVDPRYKYRVGSDAGPASPQVNLYCLASSSSYVVSYESAGDDYSLHHFYHTPIVAL